MLPETNQGRSCVFTWLLGLYAVLATIYCFEPVRAALDDFIGPNEAQLMVVAEEPVRLRDITVSYDGRTIDARPGMVGSQIQYLLFPRLRSRKLQPMLQISWRTASGQVLISQPMQQFDSGRLCLYVLRLDRAGNAIAPERSDAHSPFWWDCHSS